MSSLKLKKGVIHTGIIIFALLGLLIATSVTISAKVRLGEGRAIGPLPSQTSTSTSQSGIYQTRQALQALKNKIRRDPFRKQHPDLADKGRDLIEKLQDMLNLGHDHPSFLDSSERPRLAFLRSDFKRQLAKLSPEDQTLLLSMLRPAFDPLFASPGVILPKVIEAIRDVLSLPPLPTPTPATNSSGRSRGPCYPQADVNNDGVVNDIDAQTILNYVANIKPPRFFPDRADVNKDLAITSVDAQLIRQYIAQSLAKFPVCP